MRKAHRVLALFFSPFLIVSAVTGLLWAYAPHLYLRQEAGKPKPAITEAEEARVRFSPVDVIREAKKSGEEGKVMSVILRAEDEKVVYAVMLRSKKGPKEVFVDAEKGTLLKKPENKFMDFHKWVMKIHRLEFFGTKKELTAFPGTGLLLMLFTGLYIFKRGLK